MDLRELKMVCDDCWGGISKTWNSILRRAHRWRGQKLGLIVCIQMQGRCVKISLFSVVSTGAAMLETLAGKRHCRFISECSIGSEMQSTMKRIGCDGKTLSNITEEVGALEIV